jgi:hypothetical protein
MGCHNRRAETVVRPAIASEDRGQLVGALIAINHSIRFQVALLSAGFMKAQNPLWKSTVL